MNKRCCLLILFFSSHICYSQKSTPPHGKFLRQQLSLDAGFHYSKTFNPKPIEPVPMPCKQCTNAYVSFKPHPSTGFQFGVIYNYFLKNNLNFVTGLTYFQRTWMSEGVPDSVIKYYLLTPNPPLKIEIKEYYRSNSFEIPLMLGYKFKKLNFNVGIKYVYGEKYKFKRYYLDGSEDVSTGDFETRVDPRTYYSLRLNYTFSFKDLMLIPYFSVDRRPDGIYTFYDFQLGLQIPFLNKWQNE